VAEDPDRIDLQSILKRADQRYQSTDNLWAMWVRRNIVLVRASGKWSVEDTAVYLKRYWNLFKDLRKRYAKVTFLFDLNLWEIQTEEFRRYLKENWAHILDREDLDVLFVDANPMKRLIWISIFQLIGKRDRLFLFKDFDRAFAWISKKKVKNGA
jgi:hypothetical protein